MTSDELKAAREELGLSQDGLAKVMGLAGDRTVRKWELGERDIPGPVAVLIYVLLNCKPARKLIGLE